MSIAWPTAHPAPGTRVSRSGYPSSPEWACRQSSQPVVMRPFPGEPSTTLGRRPPPGVWRLVSGMVKLSQAATTTTAVDLGWASLRIYPKTPTLGPRTRRIQITRSSSPPQGNSEIAVPPWSLKDGPGWGAQNSFSASKHGSASRDGFLRRVHGSEKVGGHDTGCSTYCAGRALTCVQCCTARGRLVNGYSRPPPPRETGSAVRIWDDGQPKKTWDGAVRLGPQTDPRCRNRDQQQAGPNRALISSAARAFTPASRANERRSPRGPDGCKEDPE